MANIVTFDKVDGPNGWLGSMYTSPIFYENSLFATAEHLFQFTRFEGFYPKDKNGEPFRIKNDEGTLVAFDEIFMKSKLCAYRTDMIKSELETVKRKKATITDYTKSGVQRTKDLSVQYVSNPLFAKSTAKKYLKYVRNYSKLTDDELEAAYKKDEEKDLANMRKILRLKVGFNSELIGQLLRTGDATIIEDVTNRVETRERLANEKAQTYRIAYDNLRASVFNGKVLEKAEKDCKRAEAEAANPNHRHDLFWGQRQLDGEWVGQNQLGRAWMELRDELRELLGVPVRMPKIK